MKRNYLGITLGAALFLGLAFPSQAFAAQWQKDENGWWWQNDDGSYPVSGWRWLDGNGDGIAECYYFGEQGYMLADTKAGKYEVNENGAWTVDGVVQIQIVGIGGGPGQDPNQETGQASGLTQYLGATPLDGLDLRNFNGIITDLENDFSEWTDSEDLWSDGLDESDEDQIGEAEERLFDVNESSKKKRKEAMFDYFRALGLDPTGLVIEKQRVSYSSFGGGKSSQVFTDRNVLTAISIYMDDRTSSNNSVSTSEGVYSFPEYLILQTREALGLD